MLREIGRGLRGFGYSRDEIVLKTQAVHSVLSALRKIRHCCQSSIHLDRPNLRH